MREIDAGGRWCARIFAAGMRKGSEVGSNKGGGNALNFSSDFFWFMGKKGDKKGDVHAFLVDGDSSSVSASASGDGGGGGDVGGSCL